MPVEHIPSPSFSSPMSHCRENTRSKLYVKKNITIHNYRIQVKKREPVKVQPKQTHALYIFTICTQHIRLVINNILHGC